ncbi:lipopolysaccharide biosynthesis protein [Melioribacter sp. OK-6-Me]|uniref:lipopolysaccharide biosynthesis protein n=1 Tax=Melioribacter sp. OK-6-Me TaxID=3423433 RepID=UPI003ED8D0CA
MQNLRNKTLKGLFWSISDQFGVYFIRFGFSIWIARLLSPEDYGLIGLMAIFIAVAGMFSESGLQMALIQKKNADDKDFSTVFWFNLTAGSLFYILIFIFSDYIAAYFEEPALVSIAKVVSLSLIIGPFAGVQLTILSKEINFKKQAKISFISTIFSGVTGVLFAINGFAVWALVFQTLVGAFLRSLLLWIKCNWRPNFVFSISRFKELYNYGWKIFLQGLSNAIFTNMYFPLIGKYFSTADLGFYTRGKRFYDMFIQQSTIAYGRVTFPVFSSIQDDRERFLRAYIKTHRLLILFSIPLVTLLIVTTDPFIHLLLTEKWMPASPYIKLFYLMGIYFPVFMLNQNIFNAIGRSDLSLKIDILLKSILFVALLITFKFGISIIITGQIIAGFITYLVTTFLIKIQLKYPVTEQLKDLFTVVFISILVYFVLEGIKLYIIGDILILISLPFVSIIFFFVFFKLTNLRIYKAFKDEIIPYIPAKYRFIF